MFPVLQTDYEKILFHLILFHLTCTGLFYTCLECQLCSTIMLRGNHPQRLHVPHFVDCECHHLQQLFSQTVLIKQNFFSFWRSPNLSDYSRCIGMRSVHCSTPCSFYTSIKPFIRPFVMLYRKFQSI